MTIYSNNKANEILINDQIMSSAYFKWLIVFYVTLIVSEKHSVGWQCHLR